MQAPPFEEFVGTVDLDCGIPDSRCLPLSFTVELTVVFVGGLATF